MSLFTYTIFPCEKDRDRREKRLRRQLTADCFLSRQRVFVDLITSPASPLATLSTYLITTSLASPLSPLPLLASIPSPFIFTFAFPLSAAYAHSSNNFPLLCLEGLNYARVINLRSLKCKMTLRVRWKRQFHGFSLLEASRHVRGSSIQSALEKKRKHSRRQW